MRVGSGQRFAGSGRVQEKGPVDNSAWYADDNSICIWSRHMQMITAYADD